MIVSRGSPGTRSWASIGCIATCGSTRSRPGIERRILRIAGELLGVPSLAWVSVLGDGDVVLEGERLLSPWDCGQLADHLADPKLWDQSGYVLNNEARESSWGARFPQIQNLLAIPVVDKTLSGWVLAFNKRRVAGRGAERP